MLAKTCISGAKITLLCILAWLFFTVILSIFIVPFCIFVLYKNLVNIIASYRYPGSTALSGLDVSCATGWEAYKSDGKFLSNLGNIVVVSGNVDTVALRKLVQEKLLDVRLPEAETSRNRKFRFDRLRRTRFSFMGYWFWSAEIVNLDAETVVKERRTKTTDLKEFINNWLHAAYEDDCPMWGFMVYKDEDEYLGRSVIAVKLAHGLGDGYSVRTIMGALVNSDTPMFSQEALLSYAHSYIHPLELMMLVPMGPYLLLKHLKIPAFHRDALWRIEKFAESFVEFLPVPVENVRRIRRAYKCKFSDVLLAIFGNSLLRHLKESVPKNKLPTMIPFAVSREVPNRPAEICNHFAQQIFRVPVTNSNRTRNLEKLQKETRQINKFSIHKLSHYLRGVPSYLPNILFPTTDDARPGVCCALASFPDISNSKFFGPHPVQHAFAMPGLQTKNLAFFGITMTTGDSLNITLLGNRGVFKTREEMTRFKLFVEDEIKFLLETVNNRVQDGFQMSIPDELSPLRN